MASSDMKGTLQEMQEEVFSLVECVGLFRLRTLYSKVATGLVCSGRLRQNEASSGLFIWNSDYRKVYPTDPGVRCCGGPHQDVESRSARLLCWNAR